MQNQTWEWGAIDKTIKITCDIHNTSDQTFLRFFTFYGFLNFSTHSKTNKQSKINRKQETTNKDINKKLKKKNMLKTEAMTQEDCICHDA